MRVIAGKYKKSNLFMVPGVTTRPTTDYLREVVFSILGDVENLEFLDLYSGSGSVGFEALSRGAGFVDFVDFSQNSIKTMIRNIHKLKCTEDCRIHRKKVSAFLKVCDKKFDVIFLDPPYEKDLVNKTIDLILEFSLLKPDGIIIVEHSRQEKINQKWQDRIINDRAAGKTFLTILK
jgi:16S rRNA (guanine966-N2)-methyltransferase